MSELDQKGFTIIWKIENVNFVRAHNEFLLSTRFVASTLQNTEWSLRLDIFPKNMEIDSMRVTIRRLDSVPQTVTVDVGMRIEHTYRKMECVSFNSGHERCFSISGLDCKISELFLDNMLTIVCHISVPSVKSVISEKCVAQTRVGVERICCPWRVERFSSSDPVVVSLYSSVSKSAHNLECKGIKWLTDGFLSIEIGRKEAENKKLYVIGKISILDIEGRTTLSKEDKYCFLVETDVWKFQIPANKSTLLRDCKLQLSNDKLLMLCDFIFFTGITSEIVEHVWLPPVFQPIAETQKKKEDLASKTENLHGSTKQNMYFDPKCQTSNQENSTDAPSLLKEDFKKLYMQRIYCDVILSAENKSIPCHKAILCSRSSVFKAMFDNQMKEQLKREVEISDLDGDILDRFLLYLYTETLEHINWMIAKKLLYAANKYQIESLMRECSTFLHSQLTTSNVCEALEFADMHQDQDLKTACQDLIFKHATKVFASSDWKEFTVKQPLLSAETFQKYFASKN